MELEQNVPQKGQLQQQQRFFQSDMPPPPPLLDGGHVLIVNFWSFDRLLLIPAGLQLELMDLTDAITDHASEENSNIKEVPIVGELVLGKHGIAGAASPFNSFYYKAFCRGVVQDVVVESVVKAKVRFFDLGDEALLPLSDLKTVNNEIVQIPVYATEVLLADIAEKQELILWSDFEEFLSGVTARLQLEIVEDRNEVSPPKVRLTRLKDVHAIHKTLNAEILGLRKWNWEAKFEAGACTDDQIVTLPPDNVVFEVTQYDMNVPQLKIGSTMELRVILCGGPDSLLCFPSDPRFHFAQDQEALETQIAKYCAAVTYSAFYPKMKQVFLYRTGDADDGKWVRAARVWDNGLFAIDHGTTYPFQPRGTAMRALPLDFARIPALGIQCELTGLAGADKSKVKLERIREILTPQSTHQFIIKSFDKEAGIYELECPEVATALAQMKSISSSSAGVLPPVAKPRKKKTIGSGSGSQQ